MAHHHHPTLGPPKVKLCSCQLSDVAARLTAKLEAQYFDLELPRACWMEELDLSMSELYVDLAMHVKADHNNKKQILQEIGLKEIFNCEGNEVAPRRILIDGAAGFGKTTLAFKIAFDWAHWESYLCQFEFVLVVQLRQWENQSADDILADAASLEDMPKEELLALLKEKQEGVLLILDGYDELSQAGKEAVLPLLMSPSYAKVTIIVTCRNGAALRASRTRPNKLCPELVKKLTWNRCIQIRGIRKENQRHFLELYLSPQKLEAVSEKIDLVMSPETEGLFDCPLFLLLWATLLEEDQVDIPKNETELYKALFNFMIGRSLIRENILGVDETFDLFDDRQEDCKFVRRLLVDFGALALCSLAENSLLLTEKDILACCQNDERILKFGFLSANVKHDTRKAKHFYEPIHKTILEFIAAFSLSWHFTKGDVENFTYSVIAYSDVIFDDFTLVLPFLVGLLGKNVFNLLQRLECIGFVLSQCFARLQDILYRNDQVSENVANSLARYSPAVTSRDVSEKVEFLKSKFHCQLIRFGVYSQRIKVMRVFSTQTSLPADTTVPCLRLGDTVLQGQPELAEDFVEFVFRCNAALRWFNVTNYHETFLPVLCNALSSGLIDSNKYLDRLRCECNKPERLPLLVQVVQTNKLKALDLTVAQTQDEMNKLLPVIGACVTLDEFHLWSNDSETRLFVNLLHFVDKKSSLKVWKRLGFEGLLTIEAPSESAYIFTQEFRLQSCDSSICASCLSDVQVLDIDIEAKSLLHFLKMPLQWQGFSTLVELRLKIGLLHNEDLILRTIGNMSNLEVLHLTLNYAGNIKGFIYNVCKTLHSTKLKVLDIDSHEYDLSVICDIMEVMTELLIHESSDLSLPRHNPKPNGQVRSMPHLQTLGLNFTYVKGDDRDLLKLVECLITYLEKGLVSKVYISAPNIYSSDVFRKWIKDCLLHKSVIIDLERRGSRQTDTRLRKWEFDRDWYSPPEAFVFTTTPNLREYFSKSCVMKQ